ncbi:MAG: DUF1963 domain-containing protein [Phenylobacterium sp.]|uniref:YwqG family protein n=1 Tax=Phenylobacterium sp. TaxID=1871053 RepID=UPI001A4C83BE|nr:YwqG family protein [Phenylobacterium sp.]MBL8555885.1 DUF1963 domain-containing protein [Phenylobacterium sp.]
MDTLWRTLQVALLAVGAGAAYLVLLAAIAFVGSAVILRLRPRRAAKARSRSEASAIKSRMTRMALPTLRLIPAKSLAFSRFGGDPELPMTALWPTSRGRNRAFLAQIDLADVRAHGGPDWLPETGRVYAFLDGDGYGFADQIEIALHRDEPVVTREPPAGVRRYPERKVTFETFTSRPSLDWLGIDLQEIDVSEAELDELSDMTGAPFGDGPEHRIGGYPSEIQGDQMWISCELIRRGLPEGADVTDAIRRAAREWRLLLQFDSDNALGMNWGDGGLFYVFVRERDARAGDFSKTITLSQTH